MLMLEYHLLYCDYVFEILSLRLLNHVIASPGPMSNPHKCLSIEPTYSLMGPERR